MNSYHSEFYCGLSAMDSYDERCIDQNVYFNPSPTNFQIPYNIYPPENYAKQEVYPILTPECGTFYLDQSEMIDETRNFYENPSRPHQLIQLTPPTLEPVPSPIFHHQQRLSHQNRSFMTKRHRAQIAIIPTCKGNFKAVVKHKRKRTVFTPEQVEALEEIYKTKQYISREDRQNITKKLQLSDKTVKIWFQNRRLKIKRTSEQGSEESEDYSNIRSSVEDSSSPKAAHLDFVESQITENTDEFGYVTLDDGVMGDLVNVIDDVIRKSTLDVPTEETTKSLIIPIYEPISPASITDSQEEENISCWRPTEPDESLQKLFDLQTMLTL